MAIKQISLLENIASSTNSSVRLSDIKGKAQAPIAQTMNAIGSHGSGKSLVIGPQYKPMVEVSPLYITAQWNAYDVAQNTMHVAIKKGNPMDYAVLLGKTAFSKTMEQYNFHDVYYQPGIPQLIDLMI